MPDQPTEDTPSLFHVERQEVFYETTVIDAVDADTARMLVSDENWGLIVGRLTAVHDRASGYGQMHRRQLSCSGQWPAPCATLREL